GSAMRQFFAPAPREFPRPLRAAAQAARPQADYSGVHDPPVADRLAIHLLVQGTTRSFSQGGAATASYVVGLAAVAPALGRLVDRVGPRSALLACSIAFPAALLALVAAVEARSPFGWVLTFAAAAGATFPP